MDVNVRVKEDGGKDYARLQLGDSDQGSVTIEGKGAFVVAVFKEMLEHEGSTMQRMVFRRRLRV